MTTAAFLRVISLAAAVVAAPASAQSAGQPAPSPRTPPPVRAQPRAIPPAALPALPSAQQTPTRPVVLPPRTVITKDAPPAAAQAVAPVATVADVASAPAAPSAVPAAAPRPIINQPGLPPANATGRCKDGTYLTGGTAATDANCSTHGGLGVAFQAPSQAPRRVQ